MMAGDDLDAVAHDVSVTLGWPVAAARAFVSDVSARHSGHHLADSVATELHDDFVDTSWPACPIHRDHPLQVHEDRAGATWRCQRDGREIARVGALEPLARDRTDGLAGVRGVEAAYDAAWDAGDIGALVGCFTADAVLVNPSGEVASGIDEIAAVVGAFLSGPASGSTHAGELTRVAFVSDDVAIVDGVAKIEGLAGHDDGTRTLVHRFTDVLVRRDGAWRIAHVRAYDPQEG